MQMALLSGWLGSASRVGIGKEALSTDSIITALCSMDEAPWSDLRGKPINSRGVAERLKQYGIKSKNVRIDGRVLKGYERSDFLDAWRRYLGASQPGNATAATAATSECDVARVAHVALIMAEVPSVRDLSGNMPGESRGRTATAAEV